MKSKDFAGTKRFAVQRKLGSGAMGVVYQALDRERGEVVALKTLRRPDPALLYRLKKEFRALAELRHPNLVELHELESAGDRWFFTMEWVRGVDFLEWVRPGGEAIPASTEPLDASSSGRLAVGRTLDVERLRGAFAQLCAGVGALHASGKLHRDLKPPNVLVTASGQVKICDFGLVTDAAAHEQTRSRHVHGTPLYMSPEQAANQPLTTASDWYSVGAMLYVALTGRPPFSGSSFVIMRDKQLYEPPPPVAVPDLDDLCTRLLARLPERRPSMAAAADAPVEDASELERALAAIPCAVVVVGRPNLVRSFLRKVPARVLSGRCGEHEHVRYPGLDGAMDALSAQLRQLPADVLPADIARLANLFPVLRRVDAIAAARPYPDASLDPLRALLGRLGPVVLCIDDVQRAGADTWAALRELLRTPAPPVLLILAAPAPIDPFELPVPILPWPLSHAV